MSPVSLRPSTFTEGGGLIDDVDVTVQEAKFLNYDYNGAAPLGPALALALLAADGSTHEQFFSCGKADYFAPSKDGLSPSADGEGEFLAKVGDKDGLNTNTNAAIFLASLVNSGYPEDKLDAPISTLVGLQFHLKREAVKRSGLVRTGKNANREQTVVTCSKIHKLPWESAARPAAAGLVAVQSGNAVRPFGTTAKPNGKLAPGVAAASPEVVAKATEQLMAIVIEAGGPVPRAKLTTLVFNGLKGDPDQKAVSQLVTSNDFLKSVEGIKFDGASVQMA